MKEKPYYFPFNEYVKLFEEITGCNINTRQDIVKKRLERFLKNHHIQPDNVYAIERLIQSDKNLFNSFLDIFIPVESFFFREKDYLTLAVALAKKHSLKKILVAPCANGESVYSIKIISNENKIDLLVHGMDISEKAITKAQKGIYNHLSIKNIPQKILKKYFTEKENKFEIRDYIKKNVCFFTGNLAKSYQSFKYDIILCRNFLIYLKEETIKLILKNICNMLKKNGFLIVGKSELSLIKRNDNLLKEKNGDLIYFRKIKWQNC